MIDTKTWPARSKGGHSAHELEDFARTSNRRPPSRGEKQPCDLHSRSNQGVWSRSRCSATRERAANLSAARLCEETVPSVWRSLHRPRPMSLSRFPERPRGKRRASRRTCNAPASLSSSHDEVRMSQNFADRCRELSRSVSGMLHRIVRDSCTASVMATPVIRFSMTYSQCGFLSCIKSWQAYGSATIRDKDGSPGQRSATACA